MYLNVHKIQQLVIHRVQFDGKVLKYPQILEIFEKWLDYHQDHLQNSF